MKSSNNKSLSRRWLLRQALYCLGLSLVTASTLLFNFAGRYDLAAGAVTPQDIRAPREITYVSDILSRQAREESMRQVAAIYTPPDTEVARQQLERVRRVLDFLTAVRADPHATTVEKRSWILAVPELSDFPLNEIDTLLSLSEADWNRVQLETRSLLDQIMRLEEIRSDNLKDVQKHVPAQVPLDFPQDEADLVASLVQRFIAPNSFYDQTATEEARAQAAESIGGVLQTVRNGEVIIREGSVVTDLEMETLEELGLVKQQHDWHEVLLLTLFSVSSTLLFGLYLFRAQPEILEDPRQEGLVALLLGAFILLARLLIPSGPLLLCLFPSAALGMLLASTTGRPAALGSLVYLGVVSGWIGGSSLLVMAVVTLSGVTATLTLPRYEQTGAIFRSGLLGGLMAVIIRLAFSTAEVRAAHLFFIIESGLGLVGGVLSGGLTLGLLFLLAPLFDLTTTFRLIELSHPNHPLLQRLLREAPATFNHTMMVASLAEQAAERIGANALLTRAGAYYHDVGKLTRPYFFSENQAQLRNPHDRLDPQTSADIVIAHVRDGLKLARQYRLPRQVRAFISEHHGTSRASFFYQKAVAAAGGEAGLVDESLFRYPGPRPQSRETALVMLADSCEAATRAARPTSPEDVSRVVNSIFDTRIHDRQLGECPITLQELQIVKTTYIEILRAAYHPRIKYPEPQTKPEPGK